MAAERFPDWLRRAIAYEIYPQSFSDANGDGVGDLRGLIDHLDYLAWLGVDVLWLNPCFEYLPVDPDPGRLALPGLGDRLREHSAPLLDRLASVV